METAGFSESRMEQETKRGRPSKLRQVLMGAECLKDIDAGLSAPLIWERHAKEFGESSVRNGVAKIRREREEQTGSPSPHAVSEQQTIQGDNWHINLPCTRIQTLDELIAHCKVDLQVWEIEKFVCNAWEMGYKNAEGEPGTQSLYQVKAWLKRRVVIASVLEEVKKIFEDAKQYAPVYPAIIRTLSLERNLLEISIPDLHVGKLAWAEETGGDYDVRIAEQVFFDSLEALLQRSSTYKIDRVCFVVGNDLLNADDLENRTTRGTTQTTDGRQHRTFRKVRRMIVRAVETLLHVADVDVIMVPGNHDRMTNFYLGEALECWFARCSQVKINNEASMRKYYEYGRNMILFTHGSEEKRERLSQLAACEKPEMWGRTRFREAHIGHLHSTKLDEMNGFRVRMLPSLCSAEDWHCSRGFVGNLRSAEAFIWSHDEGLMSQHIYNVPIGQE